MTLQAHLYRVRPPPYARIMVGEFPVLSFELRHDSALPLSSFTRALERMNARFAREVKSLGADDEPNLYISEIRRGSTIVDLVHNGVTAVASLPHGLAGLEGVNTLWDFAKHLGELLNYFTGKGKRPAKITKADCDDAAAILAPATQTVNGGLAIYANNVNIGTLVNVDQKQAFEGVNRALQEKSKLGDSEEAIRRDVGFVWHQIRDAPVSPEARRSPDRGFIPEIAQKALQVTFANEEAKQAMTHGDFNPLEKAFIIDVKVITGPNGPLSYRVLAVHDIIDRE